jgi:hypothetical protein
LPPHQPHAHGQLPTQLLTRKKLRTPLSAGGRTLDDGQLSTQLGAPSKVDLNFRRPPSRAGNLSTPIVKSSDPGVQSLATPSSCRGRHRSGSPRAAGRAGRPPWRGRSRARSADCEDASAAPRDPSNGLSETWSGSGLPTTCRGRLGSGRAGTERLRRNSVSPCDHPPGPVAPQEWRSRS